MISLFLLYEKESSNKVFSIIMHGLIHFNLGKEDIKFIQNTAFLV